MNKKSIWGLIITLVLIIGLTGLLVYRLFFYDKTDPKIEIKVLERIDNYNYQLEDRDEELYKKEFKELKKILSKDVDYEAYATSLSKLYIIDFYSLNNKLNKYDVGSTDFIIEDDIDTFRRIAMDTYYKNVKDNTYGDRVQSLPKITNVTINNLEDTIVKIDDKKYDGYLVDITWDYDINIEASNQALLTIIKQDSKLAIYKVETNK